MVRYRAAHSLLIFLLGFLLGTIGAAKALSTADLLRQKAEQAAKSNPFDADRHSDAAVTTPRTPDPALADHHLWTEAGSFRFVGGVATPSGPYAVFPVASVLLARNGSLARYLPDTPDANAATSAVDFVTDSSTVEILYVAGKIGANRPRLIVDGLFVDTSIGSAASPASLSIVRIVFAHGPAKHSVSFLQTTDEAFYAVDVEPHAELVKGGNDDGGIQAIFTGDSYTVGQDGENIKTAGAAWPVVCSQLLGWSDWRQVAVGATGYLFDFDGRRSTLRRQIENWDRWGKLNPQVVVVASGFNDHAFPADKVGAEALLTFKAIRQKYPRAYLFVLGVWAGSRGPDRQTVEIELAVKAAVSAMADNRTVFIPVSTDEPPWINGTGHVGAENGSGNSDVLIARDHTHPTSPAGHEYLGRKAASSIRQALQHLAD